MSIISSLSIKGFIFRQKKVYISIFAVDDSLASVFLTNIFNPSTMEIANIYWKKLQVELFLVGMTQVLILFNSGFLSSNSITSLIPK